MIILDLKDELTEYFGENNILSKCSENKCNLKGITKNFIILDGDNIKTDPEKSVDCIIIDSRMNIEGKYRVILCELTSGKKKYEDSIEKFLRSGNLIINLMKKLNKEIFKIDCLLLGKIKKNGQTVNIKRFNKPVRFHNFPNGNSLINLQECGYDLKGLY